MPSLLLLLHHSLYFVCSTHSFGTVQATYSCSNTIPGELRFFVQHEQCRAHSRQRLQPCFFTLHHSDVNVKGQARDTARVAAMSRSANFFAQSFASAAPQASTSKLSQPICLSTLLKPSTTLSDLSSRLDEAVAALSQSTDSSSSDDYASDSYDEEYWEASWEEVSTPSSSVSSITPTQQLKPALRSTPSTGSNGRKASFSEEPPKVARTYSASEYPRSVLPHSVGLG